MQIRKPLVYTMTGELQNSYSLWFSEVAVAVVTCCLRWYFHVIGKENRKAACDLILYRVEGKSLTRQENEETLIYIGFHCLYFLCIQLILC